MKRSFRLLAALLGAVLLGSLLIAVTAGATPARTPIPVKNIPVLVYHELNNGCAATAAVCNAPDPESVSTAQMTAELAYMHAQGYRTINLTQYIAWLFGKTAGLPAKPFLITYDNGIGNLLQGSIPILQAYGDTAVAFLVTGFADGAAGVCVPTPDVADRAVNTMPGCPVYNENWDLSWAQIQALPRSVYQFALEAGPSGHFVQNYNAECTAFYACMAPGETVTDYENRVYADLDTGLVLLNRYLPGDVNTEGWVVPYSDLGYPRCAATNCTPQNSTGPVGWLARMAHDKFQAVFVEDANRNGIQNDRFRFDVQGWMTQSEFESALTSYVAAGSFTV